MPNDHLHEPVIVANVSEFRKHHIICAVCGQVLWFTPLEDVGIYTEDWSAREYEHTPGR